MRWYARELASGERRGRHSRWRRTIPGARTQEALKSLEAALTRLSAAAEQNAAAVARVAEGEDDLMRLTNDRARLADALDRAEARAERLEAANREVEQRLVALMDRLRRSGDLA